MKVADYPLDTSDGAETYLGLSSGAIVKRYAKPTVGTATFFNTKAEATAATVGSTVPAIGLVGYAQAGDSGQVLVCKKRVGVPSHDGYVQTADGYVFEYVMPPEGFAIEWFGGAGDCPYMDILPANPVSMRGTDNYPAFEKALVSIEHLHFPGNILSAGPRIRFRKDGCYYFSQSMQIYGTIILEGGSQGTAGGFSSYLVFNEGAHGIIVQMENTKQTYTFGGDGRITSSTAEFLVTPRVSGTGSIIRGLNLYSFGERTYPVKAHGVWMRARATVEQSIVSWWSGNCVRVQADVFGDVNSRGNANGFILRDLRLGQSQDDAILTRGGDANAGSGTNIDIVAASGWCLNEDSFLGNRWDNVQADVGGQGNIAANGVYKLYECTTDPGGSILTTHAGRPKADLASGAAFTGSDGYGWTRRDVGVWTSGSTYLANQIVYRSALVGFLRCVTPGPGTSTTPPVVGTMADGYVWADGQSGADVWYKNSNYALTNTVIWGGFTFFCDDIATGGSVEPGVDGSHPVCDAIDNGTWTWSGGVRTVEFEDDQWVLGRTYVEGGGYKADQNVGQSLFLNCYTEGGSPSNKILAPNIVIGGQGMGVSYRSAVSPAHGIVGGVTGPFRTLVHQSSPDPSAQLWHSRGLGELLTVTFDTGASQGVQLVKHESASGVLTRSYGDSISAEWMTLHNCPWTCGRATPIGPAELIYPQGILLGMGFSNTARRITSAPSMPTSGIWAQGDFVYNIAPAIAGGKVLLGWSRLTQSTGANYALNTDWAACYATTS